MSSSADLQTRTTSRIFKNFYNPEVDKLEISVDAIKDSAKRLRFESKSLEQREKIEKIINCYLSYLPDLDAIIRSATGDKAIFFENITTADRKIQAVKKELSILAQKVDDQIKKLNDDNYQAKIAEVEIDRELQTFFCK